MVRSTTKECPHVEHAMTGDRSSSMVNIFRCQSDRRKLELVSTGKRSTSVNPLLLDGGL